MQSLNSLHLWCMRSCQRHTWTVRGITCLHWGPGQVSSFKWMLVVPGDRRPHKSLSIFTYNSWLQTNFIQILVLLQVLLKELPRKLYILSGSVALALAHPQLEHKPTARGLWLHLARGIVAQGGEAAPGWKHLGDGQGPRSVTWGSHTAQIHRVCLWHSPPQRNLIFQEEKKARRSGDLCPTFHDQQALSGNVTAWIPPVLKDAMSRPIIPAYEISPKCRWVHPLRYNCSHPLADSFSFSFKQSRFSQTSRAGVGMSCNFWNGRILLIKYCQYLSQGLAAP